MGLMLLLSLREVEEARDVLAALPRTDVSLQVSQGWVLIRRVRGDNACSDRCWGGGGEVCIERVMVVLFITGVLVVVLVVYRVDVCG